MAEWAELWGIFGVELVVGDWEIVTSGLECVWSVG